MFAKKFVLGLLAFLTPVAALWAQAQRLSLQEALDLAARQNLDLAAVRRRRATALAGIDIARERPNPTATFSTSRDAPHQSLFFDQPLELAGKRGRRIDVAKQQVALTETDVSAAERQVRTNTRQAYYGLAYARAESARLARVAELARRLQTIAEDRFKSGDVPQLEVIQSGLEVSQAEADLQVSKQREKVSLSALNALLNEPATTPWDLTGGLEEPAATVALDELISRAYQSNADLQRLGGEKKVEVSNHALLKAERVPNLDLEAGMDFNAPGDYRYGPRGQVAMQIPLFSRNQGEIAQSVANQRLLDSEVMATQRSVAAIVEAGYFDLQAQELQVQLYRDKLLPIARQVESLAEDSYRAGKTGILNAIQAQQNVQSVESSYLQSLLQLQTLYATLEETVGGPIN